MRRFPASLAAVFIVAAAVEVPAQNSPLASLSWLAGCWAAERGEPGSGEHWTPLAGETMLGVSRTIRNGKTVEHEFLRIHADSAGHAVYTALPSGQPEASFLARAISPKQATFENLNHDFPQRIIYDLVTDDRLVARIEGTQNGSLRGIDFPMRRVACEAVAAPPARPPD